MCLCTSVDCSLVPAKPKIPLKILKFNESRRFSPGTPDCPRPKPHSTMVSADLPLRHTSHRAVSILTFFYYILEGLFYTLIPESWRYKDIKGQTVLITGSGSGIGQLMATKFAQLGCKLVLWDINEAGMMKTLQMISEKKLDSTSCTMYRVDLSKREQIYATAKRVKEEVGIVDILVNNAGVVSGNYFLDTPDEKNQLTFDVNVMAHFYTLKCFLPDMINQKRGHIVTTASVAGNLGATKLVDYCASKFANVGFDMALRQELAQANLDKYIKTTIVKPYLIHTGMFSGCKPYLFAPLEPEYVATRVLSGVLAESKEVVIPRAIGIIFWLLVFLPAKCLMPLLDFGGARDLMAEFEGREAQANKMRIHELNNNN